MIIHRDLKLENIMFADKERTRVKIVDFGIAGLTALAVKGERTNCGTMSYIAPEVLSRRN